MDTPGPPYLDRYAEQLWLTLFAKAPEITLFDYSQLLQPIPPTGRAAWQGQGTSFDWETMMQPVLQADGSTVRPTTMARAAGCTLEQTDGMLGELGNPVGLKSYKPYHSTGEDYLHTYLGMIGIPIDLRPEFPRDAQTVLLTECARLRSRHCRKDENAPAGRQDGGHYVRAFAGAPGEGGSRISRRSGTPNERRFSRGSGTNPTCPPVLRILIPQLQYLTNDTWERVSGVAQNDSGYPLLLESDYAAGTMFVLTVPDNFSDFYSFPASVLTQIRNRLLGDFYVRVESPGDVSLFVYDNGAFIVESFLARERRCNAFPGSPV